MVQLGEYYCFDVNSIKCVECTKQKDSAFPYRLTVYLKNSDKAYSVSYIIREDRNNAKIDLLRQIEYEKRGNLSEIKGIIRQIQNDVRRINKRQLRIWRQLRELLGVKVEGGDEK